MVLFLNRFIGARFLEIKIRTINQTRCYAIKKEFSNTRKMLIGTLGIITGGAGVFLYTLDQSVKASELELHPPRHTWPHSGIIRSLDHASIRRGYEVYKQVCASCHSLRFIAYRNLVGVTHSEAQAKAEAEEQIIADGPDENGNMFKRPGKLSDYIPNPYPNEQAARAANNGAFPPDLSYITLARHGGEDYIFALLTGYCDPPTGVTLREGLHYNPYFFGGAIGMAQPLFEDSAVYSDGTHAHASQLAKDVSAFLKWTAEPEYDDRKLMIIKATILLNLLSILAFYIVRGKFISLKTRKIQLRTTSEDTKTGGKGKCD